MYIKNYLRPCTTVVRSQRGTLSTPARTHTHTHTRHARVHTDTQTHGTHTNTLTYDTPAQARVPTLNTHTHTHTLRRPLSHTYPLNPLSCVFSHKLNSARLHTQVHRKRKGIPADTAQHVKALTEIRHSKTVCSWHEGGVTGPAQGR